MCCCQSPWFVRLLLRVQLHTVPLFFSYVDYSSSLSMREKAVISILTVTKIKSLLKAYRRKTHKISLLGYDKIRSYNVRHNLRPVLQKRKKKNK